MPAKQLLLIYLTLQTRVVSDRPDGHNGNDSLLLVTLTSTSFEPLSDNYSPV